MYVEAVIVILVLSIILLVFGYYVRESRTTTRYVYSTSSDQDEQSEEQTEEKPCYTFCPDNICNEYNWQLKAYKKCVRCKDQGYCSFPGDKPGEFHCKPCSDKRFKRSCEEQYGCRNRRGKWYAPVDPQYTKCNMCWRE